MQYYINAIKNYANFKGRARRKEYWMFTLFNIIFVIVAMILDSALGDTFKSPLTGLNTHYGFIYLAYSLFVFIPGLSVLVRRLHDIGKSGKLLLWVFLIYFVVFIIAGFLTYGSEVALVPLVHFIGGIGAGIWMLVLLCTDSLPGPNKWGPNPKGVGNIDEFDFMSDPNAQGS